MKLSHIISSIDISTGGPARSSTGLIQALLESDEIDYINLLTLKSANPILFEFNQKEKSDIVFTKSSFMDYSLDLNKYLNSNISDIYHGHGIWNFSIQQMASHARKNNRPYVISIRGMLEPWSLEQSKFKKRLAMWLYQHCDIKHANCLHATAVSEAESIRKLGYTNAIAVIPNGINTEEYPLKTINHENKVNKILFLSRIHPKKGIEFLIDAWNNIEKRKRENWKIEIAGNGETNYIYELKAKILKLNLQHQIVISGPKFGKDKLEAYQSADLFVLPTFSENFGIVIGEALSCGLPVITTKGTPWKDLETFGAGSWIDIGVDALRNTLESYLVKDKDELVQMGLNGRKLIEDKYSIESVANKFLLLYKWLLKKSAKPDFVL